MRHTLAARLVTLAACAWFAFWACAPPTTMPPPIPFAKQASKELGGAVAGDLGMGGVGTAGQFWFYGGSNPRNRWGGTLAGGYANLGYDSLGWLAGGVSYQRIAKNERTGFTVEAGFLYARVGVPLMMPLANRKTWLYTRPTVGLNMAGAFELPVGIQYRNNGTVWRAEAGLRALGYIADPLGGYVSIGGGRQF